MEPYPAPGEVNQKLRERNSFSSNSKITINNLSINIQYLVDLGLGEEPSGNLITGGTTIYEISGSGSQTGTYNITAQVVYNGDGTADIIINGNTYTINLPTGQFIK